MRISKILKLLLLVLCISAFFMPSVALAGGGEPPESLSVDAVWLDGEMLQIDVTDIRTGEKQKLELRLKDYTEESEYVSIQAVDMKGNKSNIVQIKNPYYQAKAPVSTPVEDKSNTKEEIQKNQTESAVPDNSNKSLPFTVPGTGKVVDNVLEQNGKEFFTIKSADDNVYHLIIDRQKNSDNVYLLNSVTEQDLMALAEKGNGNKVSAIPTPPVTPSEPSIEETKKDEPIEATKTSGSAGTIIIALLSAVFIGAVGYYFKVYKPKQAIADTVEDNEEELEYEDEEEKTLESDDEIEQEDESTVEIDKESKKV